MCRAEFGKLLLSEIKKDLKELKCVVEEFDREKLTLHIVTFCDRNNLAETQRKAKNLFPANILCYFRHVE